MMCNTDLRTDDASFFFFGGDLKLCHMFRFKNETDLLKDKSHSVEVYSICKLGAKSVI